MIDVMIGDAIIPLPLCLALMTGYEAMNGKHLESNFKFIQGKQLIWESVRRPETKVFIVGGWGLGVVYEYKV